MLSEYSAITIVCLDVNLIMKRFLAWMKIKRIIFIVWQKLKVYSLDFSILYWMLEKSKLKKKELILVKYTDW